MSRAERHADEEAGFTLLEALIALALLTGVAAGVMALVAGNRALQARGETALRQALAAEAVLNRVGLDIPLREGLITGRDAGGATWQVTVSPFADAHELSGPRRQPLYAVEVRVPASAREPGTVLRTLKRGPA